MTDAGDATVTAGRLLVLDDDANIGRMIQRVAEAAGLQARFTTEPAEFFGMLEEWSPTHVALDLVMPELDGVQVMVQLAERGSRARIIITSGVGGRVLEAAGRSAEEHGLDIAGVLSKPFSAAALRDLLAIGNPTGASPRRGKGSRRGTQATAPASASELTAEELIHAVRERELHLVYQPKIECASGALAGFEALLRWNHPQRGPIRPELFVPFAEACNLVDTLTDFVLDQALDWFAPRFRGSALTLAINLSARSTSGGASSKQAHDRALVEHMVARCLAHGVESSRVIFELTETSAMEDPVASLDLLTRLRMKGFQLSIDDFGTGYSSMVQLVRLPFSEIKVDRSFVMTAIESPESRTVVKSIVDLGHSLGIRAAAEGVENAETLEYLRQIGCDLAQGFFVAAPMAGNVAAAWARERPWGP